LADLQVEDIQQLIISSVDLMMRAGKKLLDKKNDLKPSWPYKMMPNMGRMKMLTKMTSPRLFELRSCPE
jgi:hypothetical protein